MLFRSAVDWWFYLVVIASMAAVFFAIEPILETPTIPTVILAIAIFIGAVALPLWLLLGTVYRVDSDQLTVRSGPFTWRVQLDEIHRVTRSRSPVSSPALSLDRLEIVYGNGKQILVSPRNHEKFLEAIGRSGET